jgi:hypothetical protein
MNYEWIANELIINYEEINKNLEMNNEFKIQQNYKLCWWY